MHGQTTANGDDPVVRDGDVDDVVGQVKEALQSGIPVERQRSFQFRGSGTVEECISPVQLVGIRSPLRLPSAFEPKQTTRIKQELSSTVIRPLDVPANYLLSQLQMWLISVPRTSASGKIFS